MYYNTIHGNIYFINNKINQIYYLNPILVYVAKNIMNIQSINKDIVDIHGIGSVDKNQIEYYKKKYNFLKSNGILTDDNYVESKNKRLSGEDIKSSIANTNQIVFEVTERCNLSCKYCGFGELYEGYDTRSNKDFDIEAAKMLLSYLQTLWNSNLNGSIGKPIYIGFYGGEPLLNFEFIKKVVEYIKSLKFNKNSIRFNMTTNSILLDKYMDFLVENDFIVTISIDGDKIHNQYRVFSDGKPSYEIVERNLLLLKEKYPQYYIKNIGISSVFHNKSSYSQLNKYILEKFEKKPRISELSRRCLSEKGSKICDLFGSVSDVYNNELSCDPTVLNFHDFHRDLVKTVIKSYNRFTFDNYPSLLYEKKYKRLPTGTCIPFSQKIYVTTGGKILPCEKINYNFSLGTFNSERINIDFTKIAETYNSIFDKYAKFCEKCCYFNICGQCVLFVDDPSHEVIECVKFKNREQFQKLLSNVTSYYEQKPEMYSQIVKQIYPI